MHSSICVAALLIAVVSVNHVASLGLTGKVDRRFLDTVLQADGLNHDKRNEMAASELVRLIQRALGMSEVGPDEDGAEIETRHGWGGGGGGRYNRGGGGGGPVFVPVPVGGGGGSFSKPKCGNKGF